MIVPLISAALSLLGSLVTLCLELVAWAVTAWFQRGIARRAAAIDAAAPAAAVAAPQRHRWRRPLLITGIATLVLTAALVVAGLCCGERILAWGIDRWSRRTGIAVAYDHAQCNVFAGTARLTGLRVRSPDGASDAYDLRLAEVEVDVAVLALLGGRLELDQARVAGVHGTLRADSDPRRAQTPPVRSSREVNIERFTLTDAQVDVTLLRDGRTLSGPLVVEKLQAEPLRRQWVLFDVLFRSQARGSLWCAPFTIASAPSDQGRVTTWTARGVPVDLLAAFVGGPCAWLRAGTVDVDVVDRWSLAQPRMIHMDYRIAGHGLELVSGTEVGGLSGRMVTALSAYLAVKQGELDLAFALDLDRDRFHHALSLDAAGLWDAIAPALAERIAAKVGCDPAEVRAAGRTIKAVAAEALERWRKR
ncbi:MAG: hypothetical protein H0W72_08315 [Planctomycetes bacterium]|nr:hypothetical protein [Planctomycetota bacterium]